MNYLVYVNGLGPNYKGDNLYEFIFSDTLEVWGDEWDSKPANGNPSPPKISYIKKVGILKNNQINFDLIQNSDFFSLQDSIDGVIALAWEKDDEFELDTEKKRLVFRFGEEEKIVTHKLYEQDIVLKFEEKILSNEIK